MLVIGIDPGWRNLSVHIASVKDGVWSTIYWANKDILRDRATYSLTAFRSAIREWYHNLAFLFKAAYVVVIERQPYRRFRNISAAIIDVIENTNIVIMDVRPMKKLTL